MTSKTTILIADDQPLIRDGLAAILGMESTYQIVAKAGDGITAIELARLHRPHLILMDIHMPRLDGLEALKIIKSELPETKILILTTFPDEQYIWQALRDGANGYMVKGVETNKMLAIVQDCLDGRINYPLSIQMRIVDALHASDQREEQPDGKLMELSVQERKIARKLKQGMSNQAIAAEMFLTTGTVKNYLSIIYKKLDVSSRAEAVAYLHGQEL